MKVLGVVGSSDSERIALVNRLADRLSDRGRVASVTSTDVSETPEQEVGSSDDRRPDSVAERRTLTGDGTWTGAGDGLTLDDALAEFAPSSEYALVVGVPEADVPTVALGGREHEGETVASEPDAESVDLDSVLAALDDQEAFETLESLVADLKASPKAEYAGAIATFTGRVRAKEGPDDEQTQYLEFERYDEVAAERMATIRKELEARDGIHDVRLHHRTGIIPKGDDIVYVAVLAGHRSEAFTAVEDGINRLKEEVPLFKKEITDDDEFWVHESTLQS